MQTTQRMACFRSSGSRWLTLMAALALAAMLGGLTLAGAEAPPSSATLTAVSGDNQAGTPGEFNAKPFDIAVWNEAGTQPLTDTEVTFTVQSGGGLLGATTDSGTLPASTLTVKTDQDGTVQAYYQQPPIPGILSQIKASAAGGEVVLQTRTLSVEEIAAASSGGKTDAAGTTKAGGGKGSGGGVVIAFLSGGKTSAQTPTFSRASAALALPSQILLRTKKGNFAVNRSNWAIGPYTGQ